MSSIVTRVVSYLVDKRLAIGNEHYARSLDVGTWSKVRCGVRISILDTGSDLPGTPQLSLGLCHGIVNPWVKTGTENFTGVRIGTGASFIREIPPMYLPVTAPACYRGVAPEIIHVASGTMTAQTVYTTQLDAYISAVPTAARSAIFIDIQKGTPCTFTGWWPIAPSQGAIDVSLTAFKSAMMAATPTGYLFGVDAQSLDTTFAASEATGAFDTFNVAWSQSSPVMELSDVAWLKLA
jgi:hypothetical protein